MKKSSLKPTLNPVWKKIYYAVGIFVLLFLVFILINGGFQVNASKTMLILVIIGIVFFICLFFFSQFVLPVTNYQQRLKAANRLVNYLSGNHGPAIFITDGELRERKDERLKIGPGVILLDSASAAVLRTSTKFIGAIGPGIAFTEGSESIAGIVDLHIQNKRLGPRREENPFAPKGESESDAAYEARQERRKSTQAITRDGIEISANLSVVFKIDARAGLGNSQFGYEPQAVERAIIGRSINLQRSLDNPEREVEWHWLPTLLAVDLWREYVSKITLNELFPLSKDAPSQLQVVLSQMRQRLTEENYQVLDEYGRIQNITEKSNEYRILKTRGIRLIAVSVTSIYLPPDIEEQLIKRWKSSWLDFAKRERATINNKHAVEIQNGKDQAYMDFSYGATHYLGSIPTEKQLTEKEILKSLINGNQYLIKQIPGLLSELQMEDITLRDILEWIDSPEGES